MDLIVNLKGDSRDAVKLVEINVFDKNARASLFDWEADWEILVGGPLQVRFLQK